jgi:hypothetical protein
MKVGIIVVQANETARSLARFTGTDTDQTHVVLSDQIFDLILSNLSRVML